MFIDRMRTYQIDGESLPSVTSILNVVYPHPQLDAWKLKTAADKGTVKEDKTAANRGTSVHKWIAQFLRAGGGGWATGGYYEAFVSFYREHVLDVLLIEQTVFDPDQRYAGTLDAQIEAKDGRVIVCDWKTSAKLWPEHAIQGAAYWSAPRIANASGSFAALRADGIWIVRLGADGNYEVREVDREKAVSAWYVTLDLWHAYQREDECWSAVDVRA
jgi:hypothetical protein